MPLIKTYDLKDFQKIANQIPSNKVNPYLAYLKLSKDGVITKTNLSITARMKVKFMLQQKDMFVEVADSELETDILVNESKLFAILNKTKSDTIEISVKNKNEIVISDKKQKNSHSIQSVDNFPDKDTYQEVVGAQLDEDVINAIKIANSFTISNPRDISIHKNVSVNANIVAGFQGTGSYMKKFSKDIPSMILTRDAVNLISSYKNITFHSDNQKYYFSIPDKHLCFIFLKVEYDPMDYTTHYAFTEKLCENGATKFIFAKSDLVDFCDLVSQSTEKEITVCSLTEKGLTLERTASNDDYVHSDVYFDGDVKNIKFNFNSSVIKEPIKALPQTALKCYVSKDRLVIKEADGSLALFQGIGGVND